MAKSVKTVRFSDLTPDEQREYLSATAEQDAALVQARDDAFDFTTPALRAAFRALPLRLQEVLRLRFCEDLSQPEIASRLFLTQPRVCQLQQQALALLRSALQLHAGVASPPPEDSDATIPLHSDSRLPLAG